MIEIARYTQNFCLNVDMNDVKFSRGIRVSYVFLSILVIFYHSGANDPEFLLYSHFTDSFFTSLRMPFYFFLGGLLLERQSHHRDGTYILKSRFVHLIIPFLWFAPIYYFIETNFSNSDYRRPKSMIFSIIEPGYHLWFLPAFFLAVVIGLLQIKFIKSRYLETTFIIFLAILSISIKTDGDGFFAIYSSIRMLPFLAAGILLSRTLFSLDSKMFRRKYAAWAVLIAVSLCTYYLKIGILTMLFTVPLIFLSLTFMKIPLRFHILSNYTLQIYLFSPLGIGLSRYILNLYGGVGVTQKVFLNVLIGLTITKIIVWAGRKYRLSSFLVGL